MEWIRVEDELPPARSKVIAFYRNSHGQGRTVFAEYIPRWTVLAEDGEQEYVAESWHELVDNWTDFSGCEIVHGTVTHWMQKPLPPIA